ncbi:MAG TPA: leucine-rich repeat domain-containing protein [Pyrinomonadaceae bacterium]|nr:leucine-rich repeat domain-containing protein [Pyrinomonadaceae bacterium]
MNDSPLTSIIETAVRDGLDTLDLHGLGLKELPPLPIELLSLRRLDLSGNRLRTVPDEVFRLTQLEELNLAGNRIAQLDPKIGTLSALRSLDLSENRLSDLPSELAGCTRLETLSLFGNQISTLPPVVLELTGLRSLDLARNRIEELPDLHSLLHLEVLDLSGNHLSTLPAGLRALDELRELDLSQNQLTSIDENALPELLKKLSLDDNLLTEIPLLLEVTTSLSARGNPLKAVAESAFRLRELVTGGYEEDVHYFAPPERRFKFAVGVQSKEGVADSLNVYYKVFNGTPVVVRLADGSRVDLTRVGRQAALHIAEPSTSALFEFSPTSEATTVENTLEFAERVLHRVPHSELIETGVRRQAEVIVEAPDAPATSEPPRPIPEVAPEPIRPIPEVAPESPRPLPELAPESPWPIPEVAPEPLELQSELGPDPPSFEEAVPGVEEAAGSVASLPAAVPSDTRDVSETSVADAEPVDVAVFCPPEVVRNTIFLLQVFLYPPRAATEVDRQAQQADETAERRGTYSLPLDLPLGTRVDLRLEIPSLNVAEPDAVLVWRGSITAAQFEVEVPYDVAAAQVIGRVRIAVDGVPTGTLRFKLGVAAAGTTPGAADAREIRARRYRRAFVSYSSKDRAEVLRRVQAFKIAGLSVFQDVLDLDPGERWEKALYREIDNCDVFLLFWSTTAAASEWVLKEIDYALARKQGDDERPPDIQPVPIEGPPIVKPPDSLKGLHFNDSLLAQIKAADGIP